MPLFRNYGDCGKSWLRVAKLADDFDAAHPGFPPIQLIRAILSSGFPEAGLCVVTSHTDLRLGPSSHVFDNPYLAIDYDDGTFTFTYLDGSRVPWTRSVPPAEAFATLEHFLIRQARWFRRTTVNDA